MPPLGAHGNEGTPHDAATEPRQGEGLPQSLPTARRREAPTSNPRSRHHLVEDISKEDETRKEDLPIDGGATTK